MNFPRRSAQRLESRRGFLRSSLGVGGLLTTAVAGSGSVLSQGAGPNTHESLAWRERALLGFGTTLWLRAAHPDIVRLEIALDAAVLELRSIESAMSLFKPDSALSRLNRVGHLLNPDVRLSELIKFALQISRQSEGAFDISVQPLWSVWQAAAQAGRLPDAALLRDARARVGWRGVQVQAGRISLAEGMALTLNGIAQGYAADRARAVLVAHGIEHALLDTGEWSALSPDFRAADWRLGVADPLDKTRLITTLTADGRSIATSSDQQTSFSADHRHHHIFDPRTGYSPTSLASVTVLAKSCALADALTKVFFMVDHAAQAAGAGLASGGESNPLIRSATALARQWEVDVLLVDKSGHWWGSSGLPVA